MNIVKTVDQFHEDCIYFCDPIKNNIINESVFIRILYSNELFILNAVYLHFPLQNVFVEKYYNKYKCSFDINNHHEIIEKIKNIEEVILKKINITNKVKHYKLYDQIKNGNIKIFSDNIDNIHNIFILKISGIWETPYEYGITYKFSNVRIPV